MAAVRPLTVAGMTFDAETVSTRHVEADNALEVKVRWKRRHQEGCAGGDLHMGPCG